ncbi:PQQ-binding-like beta-propeller repeat protein [Nocardia halotolerans]|uniref:PQQ-binding-like beta-propeller repeat protein n=1 Tax=Nocardia halotolerans TaxID=1755878 RepID=A0ABV8VIB6_9NOCA
MIALLGLVFAGQPWEATAVWSEIRENYPFSPRLPMADGAYLLAAASVVLALAISFALRKIPHLLSRIVGAGIIAGLMVSVAVGVGAARLGDDAANIDRSLAATADASTAPAGISDEAFRITLDNDDFPERGRHIEIVSTTTGFIVGTRWGVVAYHGMTGLQRWHYQRTDQGNSELYRLDHSLVSTDDGRVVVATWHRAGTIAFDSVTGEQLWSLPSSDVYHDFSPIVLPVALLPRSAPKPLLRERHASNVIAAFDPRTGRQLWVSDTTVPDCGVKQTASRSDGIYVVRVCGDRSAGIAPWLHITAIDRRTGATIAAKEIGRDPRANPGGLSFSDYRVVATSSGLVVEIRPARLVNDARVLIVSAPDHLADAQVVAVEGLRQVNAASDGGTELAITWAPQSDDYRSRHYARVPRLFSGAPASLGPPLANTGAVRDLTPMSQSPPFFLADQLVSLAKADASRAPKDARIHTWDRAGREYASIDLSYDGYWDVDDAVIIPSTGSVLVVLRDTDAGEITVIGIR